MCQGPQTYFTINNNTNDQLFSRNQVTGVNKNKYFTDDHKANKEKNTKRLQKPMLYLEQKNTPKQQPMKKNLSRKQSKQYLTQTK